ncbi:hypothetical protein [Mesorhizobium sp. L-8-3]|uniref:hypothetical protein n=1 Tax=Mesorhizobium sp. L-8-3 TaxID=2744522 RepID=UPI0019295155|nr:hypothetical protein [Mesorhizobium sp. L-8-3]
MDKDSHEETSSFFQGRIVMTSPTPTNDTAPAERPGLPSDAAQGELLGLSIAIPMPPTEQRQRHPETFDWFTDEAVIVERQPSIAVYRNPRGHVVIRAEGDGYDEDTFIYLSTEQALKALIAALQRELQEGG